VEWLESKPAGWRTGLAAEERGGLTRARGSIASQTERQGLMVVEQRSSRGRWKGGQGNSWHRCGAQSGVGRFGGGPGRRFTAAERWQARQRSGGNRRRRGKGLLHGEGCSFYTHRRRLAKGGVSYGRGRQSGGGHGLNAVGTGGTVVISGVTQTGSNLKIENGCLTLL
jgi:hypothetical protein